MESPVATGRFFKITGFKGTPIQPPFARAMVWSKDEAVVESYKVVKTKSPEWKRCFVGLIDVAAIKRSEYNDLVKEMTESESVGNLTAGLEYDQIRKRLADDRTNEKKLRLKALMMGLANAPDPNRFEYECMLEDPTVLEKWSIVKRGAQLLQAMREKEENEQWVADQTLRYWQAQLLQYMSTVCDDDRIILWVTDEEGGSGKTWFSKYLYRRDPTRTVWIHNGSTKDLMKAIYTKVKTLSTVIMDLSRTNYDKINWDVIERVKNGMIMSTKYEVESAIIDSPCVLCFANYHPDFSKMSEDRWRILTLKQSGLVLHRVHQGRMDKGEPLPELTDDVCTNFGIQYRPLERKTVTEALMPETSSSRFEEARPLKLRENPDSSVKTSRNPFAVVKPPPTPAFGPGRIGILKRCASCYTKYRLGQAYPPWGNCTECMMMD